MANAKPKYLEDAITALNETNGNDEQLHAAIAAVAAWDRYLERKLSKSDHATALAARDECQTLANQAEAALLLAGELLPIDISAGAAQHSPEVGATAASNGEPAAQRLPLERTPQPGSPVHGAMITASKIAAIMGDSPRLSPYGQWVELRQAQAALDELDAEDVDLLAEPDGKPAAHLQRGHILEDGLVRHAAETVELAHNLELQVTYGNAWTVATLDGLVSDNQGKPYAVVEAKTVGSMENAAEWGEPGDPAESLESAQIPLHVKHQIVWQAALSGAPYALVVVLLPFLQIKVWHIAISEQDKALTLKAVGKWWFQHIDGGVEPDPWQNAATPEQYAKAHPDIDAALEVETGAAGVFYAQAKADLEQATQEESKRKLALLEQMGRAKIGLINGAKWFRRQPGKFGTQLRTIGAGELPEPAEPIAIAIPVELTGVPIAVEV